MEGNEDDDWGAYEGDAVPAPSKRLAATEATYFLLHLSLPVHAREQQQQPEEKAPVPDEVAGETLFPSSHHSHSQEVVMVMVMVVSGGHQRPSGDAIVRIKWISPV